MRLTKAQAAALAEIDDREPGSFDEFSRVASGTPARTLGALVDMGLVTVSGKRHWPTWRLTPAGREALAASEVNP